MRKIPKRAQRRQKDRDRIAALESALRPFAAVALPGDKPREGLGLDGYKGRPSEGARHVWLYLGTAEVIDRHEPHLGLDAFHEARRLV